MIKSKVFGPEEVQFIVDNIKGRRTKDLQILVNQTFNKNYTFNQVEGFKSRNNLKNGLDSKGQTPWNKGKAGWSPKGSERTRFQKGQVSVNHRPVGSERKQADGYTMVKVEEPSTWELKHRLIYEECHGEKLSKDDVIVFVDGDKNNFDIKNLRKIKRGALAIWNHEYADRRSFESDDPTLAVAQLKHMVGEKRG